MSLSGLVAALLPVFFVLALGYGAGKRNAFDPDQAAGLSKLAVSFALPASLFVGMTEIPRDLLLQQGSLVLALILAHVGLFFVAWAALGLIQSVRGTPAILYAMMLSTSATPVFGLAVLQPILGPTATGAVGLVALSINLVVPATVVLLEVDAAKRRGGAKDVSTSSPVLTGLASGLKSPLLWAPIVGIAIVIAKVPLPRVIAACFQLIGSTTSGVAVFAVGLYWPLTRFSFPALYFSVPSAVSPYKI
ncbi:MAG: AEC family transporter [Terriglobales bacterium]|jgi:predicted permease